MDLTVRERQVLYGLVRWPGLNDFQLSDTLDLGRSTVTAVRQRLEKRGAVSTSLIPDFERIGCGLLTTLYGEFKGATTHSLDDFRVLIHEGVSSIFYMIRAGGLHLSLGAARDLNEVGADIKEHHRLHHESGFLSDMRHNYVFFPLKHTHMPRFFDYAPLLASSFGFEHKAADEPERTGVWRPTSKEKSTLHALVRNPREPDAFVASEAGVSRQTVNTLRNKFLDEGLLRVVRIPDVSLLGFNVMAFTHLHMNPHHGRADRRGHVKSLLEDPAHVLKISGDLESVLLSVHSDYGEFTKSHQRILDLYGGDRFSDKPTVHLFPLERTENVVNHDYGNLVTRVIA
ncbi:MAG: Lrp/AsnC family transcriptional regulator [Candidatus Altiarchaeota archaeon]